LHKSLVDLIFLDVFVVLLGQPQLLLDGKPKNIGISRF